MVLAKATVIGAGLVLAPFDAARAQGGVADSVLRATRHWIDSLDARSGRRWPAGCPSYSDFPYMATTIPGCQISGIPAPTSYDTARVLSFQHLESPFMHAGPPRPVERLDAADSIPIVVGDWHGLIEAHRLSGQKDVGFVLAPVDVAGSSHADFALRCRKGVLEALLEGQQSLGRGHSHAVIVRLGAGPPQRERWLLGHDSTTLVFAGDQRDVRAFVRTLGGSSRLALEVVRPRPAPPSIFVFDLDGIPVVVTQLESACR